MGTMATPTLALLPENSPMTVDHTLEKTTLQRSRTSGTLSPSRVLSRLPSPSRSRANTAPSRPGSLRRTKTDVDDAIRELNTIVEERRASAYRSSNQSSTMINRPPPSPSHHVPYIAPSMPTSSPPRKLRRVPAPLTLVKEKEIAVEAALASARSTRSFMNAKPPMSPNFHLLKGMEITAKDVGINGRRSIMAPSPGAVGVAF
ncbi:hypothetical protein TUN205_07060 [Pyrenophora tritici-repentis]|nr:hypothetical protein TUN205_07060 [Pyrenophora tritici-repentis]